jgi:hypothetical protein
MADGRECHLPFAISRDMGHQLTRGFKCTFLSVTGAVA